MNKVESWRKRDVVFIIIDSRILIELKKLDEARIDKLDLKKELLNWEECSCSGRLVWSIYIAVQREQKN